MKKNILLLLALAAAILSGCNLTTVPEDRMTPERYFSSAASLEQWLNNCYTEFENYNIYFTDADDCMDNGVTDLFGRTRQAATESWSWTMLRRINYFLEHSSACPDEEAVAYYNGEARFFRALFYWHKVRKYGDIMWIDKALGSTDPDVYKPRDDRGYVVDRMIEDLDAAAAVLSEDKNAYSSAVNKWVALALKSRVCLYEGTFRLYHGMDDASKYLEQCVSASEEIISSGRFQLYNEGSTPYRDLFCIDPCPSEETILARVYNSNIALYHSISKDITSVHRGFTQRFVNHYLMSDGSFFSSRSGYATKTFAEVFEDRDPRMAQTIWGPGGVDYTGHSYANAFNLTALTGYYPLKFNVDVTDISNRSEDIALIRYAEILLNYAEAKAELGTLTQADVTASLDLIRQRAGMPDFDLERAKTVHDPLMEQYYPQVALHHGSADAGVIYEVRRERTVELAMEGFREWDLLRWKEGAAIDNGKNPFYGVYFPGPGVYDINGDGTADFELFTSSRTGTVAAAYQIDIDIYLSEGDHGNIVAFKGNSYSWNEDRDYLWPIPAAQRALYGGILTQNPGWEDGLDF